MIDPGPQTLYVSAMTSEKGVIKHKLHAISIVDGSERANSPTEITATVAGTGLGNDGNGHITFLPEPQNQRPGLQLVNGVVFVTFASYSDVEPYHGWIFAIDANSMKILTAMNVTPSTEGGGIWQAGSAPTADADGNVYLQTGDGEFTMNTGGSDIGDSTLKLHMNGASLDLVDWFTPFNQDCLNRGDLDYGSGAPIVLPDQPGALPHLLVTGTKEGRIYLLNRDSLDGAPVQRTPSRILWDPIMAEKGGYRHFMLKEIFEQPRAAADTMRGRIPLEGGTVVLPDVQLDPDVVAGIQRVVLVACGTSYHAAIVGRFMMEA